MVGSRAERGGIIKDGAKMVNAVANSTVPKITLFVGNSYGAGNYAMCGKAYGARFLYAWPSASIAVMGGDQASKTLLSIQLKNRGADVSEEEKTQRLEEIKARYAAAMDPRYAAARLWVDAIIDPAETREVIGRSLACAAMNPEIAGVQDGGAADVGAAARSTHAIFAASMKTIRIGNGQGFWGDNVDAPVELLRGGPIDYIGMDYLAEVTLSIMMRQKLKNPKLGYATDFIGFIRRVLPELEGAQRPRPHQRRRPEPQGLPQPDLRGGARARRRPGCGSGWSRGTTCCRA